MNLSLFPSKFDSESRLREQKNIESVRNEKQNQKYNINTKRSEKTTLSDAISMGVGLGFIVGIIYCFVNCDGGLDNIWVVLGLMIIGAIGGAPLWIIFGISRMSSNSNADRNIEEVEQRYSYEEERIKEQAKQERQNYLREFEAEAQRRSVQFASSELAQEVITWMSEGFYKNIDATDRRSHIEQILVPFLFSVYSNKISCNLGTYDFEINRCQNLNSPVDQTALARAIASTVQLNVMMKYPNDISGTAISITIEYKYRKDCVDVVISYTAPNGYYKAVKSW